MARRGADLREHILAVAKDAFLETGFERTSMDELARRAATSKRSLYAHFPTKNSLLLAVVDRTRDLFGDRVGVPDPGLDPTEATVRYCGRLLQLMRWSTVCRTLRLGIADSERLPDMAVGVFDAILGEPLRALSAHVARGYGLSQASADELADRLIGATVLPTLIRLLAGVERASDAAPETSRLEADVDLEQVATSVSPLLPIAHPVKTP